MLMFIERKPFVIAEAGCNHMGKMEIAKELNKSDE